MEWSEEGGEDLVSNAQWHILRMRNFFLLRCEDLKQEREAVVDCMMELESDFLTATNEKKVVMILDHACRNVDVGKSIK